MITHKGVFLTTILVLIHLVNSELKPERRLGNTSSYITCTKSFSENKFVINLPKTDEISPYECKFTVTPSSSDVCRLKLNFKQFTLRSSTSCRDQFLRVGGLRLCGSILGPQTVSFSKSPMIIHYRGDGEHSLLVEVEQEHCQIPQNNCDVTSSELQTVITSPNFPNPYPTFKTLACTYNINPNSPNICQLDIKFNYFQIPDSENCSQTRLLIDGKPYCGQKTGLSLTSKSTPPSKIEFSSIPSQESGSFELIIKQIKCEKSLTIPGNISANQVEIPTQFPPLCCNRVFDSRKFILSSPGFLDSVVPNLNCVYQIARSSPSVCRLRISFLHFWLGQEDVFYGCTDGFLEIDGRRICGCKDGLVFDTYFVGERKDFWLNMRGLQGKGFVIEVTQEDCGIFRARSIPEEITENPNTEVEVFSTNSTVEKIQSRFFVPSDDSRCYQWGLPHWLDKIREILRTKSEQCPVSSENPQNPLFPPENQIHLPSCHNHNPLFPPNPQPPIIPPPFPPNPQPPIIPPPFPPNPQPPIIPPPFSPNPQPPIIPPPFPPNPQSPIIPPPFPPNPQPPIIPPPFPPNPQPPIIPPPFPPNPQPPIIPPPFPPNPQPPIIPPPFPPNPRPPIIPPPFPPNPRPPIIPPPFPPNPRPPIIPPPYPPSSCPHCPQPPSRQCQFFSTLQGGFQSPGYPWKYPSNLKCCYRFQQQPGYCSLQVSFLDFDICWSLKCWKDFLLLDQRARYCSQSLQSSAAFVPFRNGFASIDFITDDFLSGRGFRAVYRQIPCSGNPFLRRSDSKQPNDAEFIPKTPADTTTEFLLNVSPE